MTQVVCRTTTWIFLFCMNELIVFYMYCFPISYSTNCWNICSPKSNGTPGILGLSIPSARNNWWRSTKQYKSTAVTSGSYRTSITRTTQIIINTHHQKLKLSEAWDRVVHCRDCSSTRSLKKSWRKLFNEKQLNTKSMEHCISTLGRRMI